MYAYSRLLEIIPIYFCPNRRNATKAQQTRQWFVICSTHRPNAGNTCGQWQSAWATSPNPVWSTRITTKRCSELVPNRSCRRRMSRKHSTRANTAWACPWLDRSGRNSQKYLHKYNKLGAISLYLCCNPCMAETATAPRWKCKSKHECRKVKCVKLGLLIVTVGALNLWPNISQLSIKNSSFMTKSNCESVPLTICCTAGWDKPWSAVSPATQWNGNSRITLGISPRVKKSRSPTAKK